MTVEGAKDAIAAAPLSAQIDEESILYANFHGEGVVAVSVNHIYFYTQELKLRIKVCYAEKIKNLKVSKVFTEDKFAIFVCIEDNSTVFRFFSFEDYDFFKKTLTMKTILDLKFSNRLLAVFRPLAVEVYFLNINKHREFQHILLQNYSFNYNVMFKSSAPGNFVTFLPDKDFLSILYCYNYDSVSCFVSILFYLMSEAEEGYVSKNNLCVKGSVLHYEVSPDLVLYGIITGENKLLLFERMNNTLIFAFNNTIRVLNGLSTFAFCEDSSKIVALKKDMIAVYDLNNNFVITKILAQKAHQLSFVVARNKIIVIRANEITLHEI